MKFGSLFSGIGGFDLGFEQAGMQCAWQCEIDKHARSVLATHWPGVPCIEDVRDVRRDTVAAVDLICGGFPCQDLSVAGKRAGLAGERSGLWFEFHRVLADLRPQWVVVENVPGLLSSHRGADFAIVLRGLVELRYGVSWRILDAQYFGVAQRRRRVFIVGSLGDGRSAEILFEREGLFGHPPARRAQGEEAAGILEARTSGGGFPGSDGAIAGHVVPSYGPQTFDWQAGVSANDRTEIADKPGRTRSLTASRTLAVVFGGNNTSGEIDIATAVNAAPNHRYDFESETFVFEPRYARNGRGAPDTIAPPLKAQNGGTGKGDGAPVVVGALHNGTPGRDASDAKNGHLPGGVRRLTPTECTRLQGFPDDWQEVSDANETQAHAREVLHGMWREVGAKDREGRRLRIALALLTPEILLAGVHGGWVSWEMAARSATASREIQGKDTWPESFLCALRQANEDRPSPYRRQSFEQFARELGRPLQELSLEGAQARAHLLGSELWPQASQEWPLRYAQSESETRLNTVLSDSARYRQLGNAVAVPVARWIGTRIMEVLP